MIFISDPENPPIFLYEKTFVIITFLYKPKFIERLKYFLYGWRVYWCKKNKSWAIKRKVKGQMSRDGWHYPYFNKYWRTHWPYGLDQYKRNLMLCELVKLSQEMGFYDNENLEKGNPLIKKDEATDG